MGTWSCPDVLHTTDSGAATEPWPGAPSPAGATEELRAGLACPALLQPLPCTSDGTRSPSYTAEREGQDIQHKHRTQFLTLQDMYTQKHL